MIAANRLPVTRGPDGEWQTSPGGLVRALLPTVRESRGSWVGWTGERDGGSEAIHGEGIELFTVPLSSNEVDRYYEGFSNDTLWPLYHDAIRDSGYHSTDWDAYAVVNQRFATRIAEIIRHAPLRPDYSLRRCR